MPHITFRVSCIPQAWFSQSPKTHRNTVVTTQVVSRLSTTILRISIVSFARGSDIAAPVAGLGPPGRERSIGGRRQRGHHLVGDTLHKPLQVIRGDGLPIAARLVRVAVPGEGPRLGHKVTIPAIETAVAAQGTAGLAK